MQTITLHDIEQALGGRGARTRIAAACEISQQAVGTWFRKGRIPESRALTVAAISGYTVEQVIRARGADTREAADA